MTTQNASNRLPSIPRARTSVVYTLVSAVLSLLMKGVRGFKSWRRTTRPPDELPDSLREDVGLPPRGTTRKYWDHQ